LHRCEVGDCSNSKIDLAANRGEIGLVAGGKIVEDYYFMISADKFVDDIRADKAGAARNKIAHAGIPLRFPVDARRDLCSNAESDAVAGVVPLEYA
jgi:hypothetical protein